MASTTFLPGEEERRALQDRAHFKVPVNILLVDDQPSKLLSYEAILSGLGENLLMASSGREALQHLLQHDVAVVLIDVCMPELDGFEMASMIRNHPRFQKTAIILVSGVMVEDVDRLRGYDSGAVDYVSVPIIPEILRAKVSVFAELSRKTEALRLLNQELERRVAERTAEIGALLKTAEEARREAEKANSIKDEFLAILSHELRTPLNSITGWAHMLSAGSLDPATQLKAVDSINRNAILQSRLISDLLDISRIVTGRLRLDLMPVDLASTIQAACDTIRPAAASKDVQIEATVTAAEPISGDPGRLQQVIVNLLSNAVKFAPVSGRVQVRLERVGSSVELTVQDNGPGVHPEVMPYIFERFRQGDSSSTRAHRGLGLGLAIARHLVEMHGGTIQARNREGTIGAIFTVRIPMSRLPVAAFGMEAGSPGPASDARGSNALRLPLSNAKVLVVDDDADAREVVATVLERGGAQVMVAASAADALLIIERELPDVLVADIEMPDQDGYDLIRKVRRLASDRGGRTPAVALTAYAGASDRVRLLDAGFERHVPKPIQPPELVSVVGSMIAKPQSEAAGESG
ncbi:MAG: response regulator [Terriglobia bacterium]